MGSVVGARENIFDRKIGKHFSVVKWKNILLEKIQTWFQLVNCKISQNFWVVSDFNFLASIFQVGINLLTEEISLSSAAAHLPQILSCMGALSKPKGIKSKPLVHRYKH